MWNHSSLWQWAHTRNIVSPSIYSNVKVQVNEGSSVLCSPIKRVHLKEKGQNQDQDLIFCLCLQRIHAFIRKMSFCCKVKKLQFDSLFVKTVKVLHFPSRSTTEISLPPPRHIGLCFSSWCLSIRDRNSVTCFVSKSFWWSGRGVSCTNLPMNSWWEFLQWRNMGSLVSSARSNCFSKYLLKPTESTESETTVSRVQTVRWVIE